MIPKYILMEQFNEVAFTFNGTIAYIYHQSVTIIKADWKQPILII